jgi:hypothetical protein
VSKLALKIVGISSQAHMLQPAIFKRFQNAKSEPKFGRRKVVLVIPVTGKKVLKRRSARVFVRKNIRDGVPALPITRIPLITTRKSIIDK